MYMTFEWDEKKNSENIKKHTVSFEKAQDAFFDENRMILEDVNIPFQKSDIFALEKQMKEF